MDFIIFGSTIFIIFLIVRLYNYYKPTIDIVLKDNQTSILLWYNHYEAYAGIETEERHYKILMTFNHD